MDRHLQKMREKRVVWGVAKDGCCCTVHEESGDIFPVMRQATSDMETAMAAEETSDTALIAAFVADEPGSFDAIYVKYAGLVFSVAMRWVHSRADAEDITIATFIVLVRKRSWVRNIRNLAAWFHGCAVGVSRNFLRSEKRRAEREREVHEMQTQVARETELEGVITRLDEALSTLPARQKEALVLQFYRGMSRKEIALELGCSETTIGWRVSKGLERLRMRLSSDGVDLAGGDLCKLTPALLLVPPDAGLMTKLHLLSKGQMIAGNAAELAGSAIKSILWAKAKMAVLIAASVAVLAGGVVTVAQVLNTSGAKDSAAASTTDSAVQALKSMFSTPIWHPDARWENAGDWAGVGPSSYLDGPRGEVMWRCGGTPPYFQQMGGINHIWGYDAATERIHAVAFSGRGLMDGPFSRARFEGPGYFSGTGFLGRSPDGRFLVIADQRRVRTLDFKDQMVRTILPPEAGLMSATVDSKGNTVALLGTWNDFRVVTVDSATGKTLAETAMKKATDGVKGMAGIAMDDKHNRLYACGTPFEKDGKLWHVWYFDLADGGSFHGVLAGERIGPNVGYAGPFDGFKGYPDKGLYFGPEDPDFRFLYMPVTDTSCFMRLDLEKRMVAACSNASRDQPQVMFVEQGVPNSMIPHVGPAWLPNGDFVMPGVREGPAPYFRRVK